MLTKGYLYDLKSSINMTLCAWKYSVLKKYIISFFVFSFQP